MASIAGALGLQAISAADQASSIEHAATTAAVKHINRKIEEQDMITGMYDSHNQKDQKAIEKMNQI